MFFAGKGGFIPENRFRISLLFPENPRDFREDSRARLGVEQTAEKTAERFLRSSLRPTAAGEDFAAFDFVYIPAVGGGKHFFQYSGGFGVQEMIIQFPPVIEFVPRGQWGPALDIFPVNVQIPAAARLFCRPVFHAHGRIFDAPSGRDTFVNATLPYRKGIFSYNPFPIISAGDGPRFIDSRIVRTHDHVGQVVVRKRVQPFFQPQKFFLGGRGNHVVGVQPQEKIPCGQGKRKIPRPGKIVCPFKGRNVRAESLGDFPRTVARSRIGDYHFVRQAPYAFKTPPQYLFFIFYDHAKGYFPVHCHLSLLFHNMI